MDDELALLIVLFAFMSIIILAVVLSSNERSAKEQQNQETQESVIKSTSCLISLDLLPDVSSMPCCANILFPDTRYDATNNVVLGASANYYLDSCSGFCPDGLVDYTTKVCLNDPSNQNFLKCTNRISPTGCDGLALPVGRVGLRYFYTVSATDAICPTSTQYAC